MNRLLVPVLACGVAVLLCGCGKKQGELNPSAAVEKYGKILGEKIKESKSSEQVMYLKNKLNVYKMQEGQYPPQLQDLVTKGIISELPQLPPGKQYDYNPITGALSVK